jgi:hypothetical protein
MSRAMLTFRLTCLAGASGADFQADVLWGTPSVKRIEETFVPGPPALLITGRSSSLITSCSDVTTRDTLCSDRQL